MTYIKDTYPREKFETAYRRVFSQLWQSDQDLSDPVWMSRTLEMEFSDTDAAKIMEAASSVPVKEKLARITQEAVDSGAFGAPWMLVTNSKGEREPFFGSDRYDMRS